MDGLKLHHILHLISHFIFLKNLKVFKYNSSYYSNLLCYTMAGLSLADKYVKLDPREHVLTRPGMYIGSIEEDSCHTWIFDKDDNKMIKKTIKYTPGLYKIFDEILVNAIDHSFRLKTRENSNLVKNIKVNIDKEQGLFEVTNDGEGIDIDIHPEHKLYIPELIFGHMLTSTNYDDNEEKTVGGQNGLGAKCLALDTKVPLFNGQIKLAKDIEIGDILIGDEGNKRNVLSKTFGKSKMYEIEQSLGEKYQVNEDHILTMHMPDHKVIYWKLNGWNILWWDHQDRSIKAKFFQAESEQNYCQECDKIFHSNLKRHYKRIHPDIDMPKQPRKSPTKTPDMKNPDILKAYEDAKDFASLIDDNNVIDISILEYMKLPKTTQKRLAGVRGNCVNWDYKDVELDPYLLGLWLGDGIHHGYSYVCDGENDTQLIDYINQWCDKNDAFIKKTKNKYVYQISSSSRFGKKGSAPLAKLLRKYDLIKNKHIPHEYIVNSREVRLALLAGLIDTDGTVSRNGTRISITQGLNHERLIKEATFLARSLGFCCSLTIKNTSYTWNGEKRYGKAYNLNISGNVDDIPTLLPRKKCTKPKLHNTDKTTGQIKIKQIEDGDYIGIKIDGNERFVINDFTVTHNCCGIFSEYFEIETVDAQRKLHYVQRFEDNLSVIKKPVITKYTKKSFTTIRFKPDFAKFNKKKLDNDMFEIMSKRVYDACAVTDNEINIYFNNEKLDYKNFEKYVDLYLGSKTEHPRVYEKLNDRWEIVASYNDNNGFDQISFVNGLWTIRGGKHVECILNQISKKLVDLITKKHKTISIKPQTIKDNLFLFIKSTIVNPVFDSQSKETLQTPISKFGSKPDISDKFIEKLYKTGIVEKIVEISQLNTSKILQKSDGKKRNIIRGLPKLEDANWAGTNKSTECILILTEGDSAMSMAVAGLSEVGRDRYGVFPLKGKVMNVRDTNAEKIANNDEITNIKKILGLVNGKKYEDLTELRYGKIMLMVDSDTDGSHIRGLLFNLFHTMWPSLLECNKFMTSMLTPIVKVTKGDKIQQFYNLIDYEEWAKINNNGKGWEIKYYKGLGTSTSQEAKQYFKELKIVHYKYTEESDKKLDLAFNKQKGKADNRKEWLGSFDKNVILDYSAKEVSYEDFIDKELIHFSNYDVERSIPNICDGLKISQRKILFGCFKKNLTKEIKVAQLAGYVSETAAYHHGEASLQSAIIGMAQNFVGSNNINLLQPNGQFGTRRCGNGKDAASPRYIYTLLSPITSSIYQKADQDILTYQNDDGFLVEPEYYMPILPMILVNGAIGIGTGFSTNIPCFNPLDVVSVLKKIIRNEDVDHIEMIPWYKGFKGTIEKKGKDKFISKGTFVKTGVTKVDITELPIGFWTQDFKEELEDYLDKNQDIRSYESHYTETEIKFTLHFASSSICEDYLTVEDDGITKLEKVLKLTSAKNLGTSNMYLFNSKRQIQKYDTPVDIIKDFYLIRLEYYQKRKDMILSNLEYDMELLKNKIKFIKEVIDEVICVYKMTKNDLEKYLEKNKYKIHNDSYDYILKIPVYNLTIDKVEELLHEFKKAEDEINKIKNKDIKDWWLEELDNFLSEYDKFMILTSFQKSKVSLKKNIKKN